MATARSQPCTTTSSRATNPAISPGISIGPAFVIPVQAVGSSQAAASAMTSAEIVARQFASNREPSPEAVWSGMPSDSFVAAKVKALANPPMWSSRSPTL